MGIKILSIDPGARYTGIATYIDNQLATCTLPGAKIAWEGTYTFIQGVQWSLVVCEGFSTPGLIASYGIDTVELIGGIKALCWMLDIPCKIQYPIERRGSIDDANRVIKEVIGKKRYPDHEESAMAHLLTYFRKNPSTEFVVPISL